MLSTCHQTLADSPCLPAPCCLPLALFLCSRNLRVGVLWYDVRVTSRNFGTAACSGLALCLPSLPANMDTNAAGGLQVKQLSSPALGQGIKKMPVNQSVAPSLNFFDKRELLLGLSSPCPSGLLWKWKAARVKWVPVTNKTALKDNNYYLGTYQGLKSILLFAT